MGFLAPAFAAFAVLAAVPVLLHLYGRPRAETRRFAALRFLVESERQTAARRRLVERLLLVARAAAIAAVPLLLAKPFFETHLPIAVGIGERESAVIVLDDSRSMGFRDGRRTRFDEAVAEARHLIASLGSDSEVALLTTTGTAAPQPELSPDREKLQRALDAVNLSARKGDTTAALRRAAAILAASPRPTKRVYLLSDLAAHGFAAEPPWGGEGPSLVVPKLSRAKEAGHANRVVVGLRVEPARELGPRGLAIEATVENDDERAVAALPVTLRIDGKVVAKGLVELPAKGRVVKRFSHVLDEAAPARADLKGQALAHEVEVEIEGDALPSDDRRYAMVEEPRTLRVLLVDGDARTVRRDDELYYLEAALRAGGRDDAWLDVEVVQPEDLMGDGERGRARLAEADVVFLANLKAPEAPLAAALDAFVSRGGGLFVSVGDNVDPDAWNAALGSLLPQPMAVVRTMGTMGAAPGGEHGEHIGQFDPAQPLLAPFDAASAGASTPITSSADSALRGARIQRFVLLRPTPHATHDDGPQTILRLESGAPLLVEGTRGHGRVLLLTTTLDRDWSDLAIQPGFLPLVQQAVRRLAHAQATRSAPATLVGEPHTLTLPDDTTRVEVTLPSGAARRFDEVLGRRSLRFDDTAEPGFYRVALAHRDAALVPEPARTFAVNVDPAESDLAPVAPARLAALSHPGQPDDDAAPAAPRHRVELWRSLGAVLLALLLVEGLLTLRGA